jgi:hypothetical protein
VAVSPKLVGEAKASVAIEHVGADEVRYRGSTLLAVGVELVELAFDDDGGNVRFKTQSGPLRVRGAETRAFIGPVDGDAFIDLG